MGGVTSPIWLHGGCGAIFGILANSATHVNCVARMSNNLPHAGKCDGAANPVRRTPQARRVACGLGLKRRARRDPALSWRRADAAPGAAATAPPAASASNEW